MEQRVADALASLYLERGAAWCSDPNKVEAALKDLCPGCTLEVNLLSTAAREGVPGELSRQSAGTPLASLLGRLSSRMESAFGLSPDRARWAVEAWACATGAMERAAASGMTAPAAYGTPTSAPMSRTASRFHVLMGVAGGSTKLAAQVPGTHETAMRFPAHITFFLPTFNRHAVGATVSPPVSDQSGPGQSPVDFFRPTAQTGPFCKIEPGVSIERSIVTTPS